MPRKQCKRCPWKTSTNPHEIPGGYCEQKHIALRSTLAPPLNDYWSAAIFGKRNELRMMACHETLPSKEKPCVGWIHHQVGPGNNIPLRLAIVQGHVDGDYTLDGPQHENFEDTLP